MAKKQILYPVIKETTYYSDSWSDRAGQPKDVAGSLVPYPDSSSGNIEYVENRVFTDTLTYTGFGRGRSSAVFYFVGSKGETYQMFMTDMDDLIKYRGITDKQVDAWWTYQKRGQNYGIRLADSERK